MKNKVYELWYEKNKKQLNQKRREIYAKRKAILENIRFYQKENDIDVVEYTEDYHCSICDMTMLNTSKYMHWRSNYHKYNEKISESNQSIS